jgi:hypothetical protein
MEALYLSRNEQSQTSCQSQKSTDLGGFMDNSKSILNQFETDSHFETETNTPIAKRAAAMETKN